MTAFERGDVVIHFDDEGVGDGFPVLLIRAGRDALDQREVERDAVESADRRSPIASA